MLGCETGAEFLNWGHLPLSEFRNFAGPGRGESGPGVGSGGRKKMTNNRGKSVPGDESRFRVLGWERGAEFLNWGHLPMPEFRNLAGPGRSGPIVPHFLPTLSVRLGAGFAGLGWADSHFSGPHRCGLKMDRFRLSDYASARAGPGRLFNTPLGVA